MKTTAILFAALLFFAAPVPAGEERLHAPLISPAGGAFGLNEYVSVHIRSRSGTTIVYTLDNSLPSENHGTRTETNSVTFALPPGDTVIRAIAVRSGVRHSPTAVARFTRSGG